MYTEIKTLYRCEDIKSYFDKDIELGGWIRTVRDNKNFAFVELNDGSFFKSLQVVVDCSLENYNEIVKLGVGSSIIVKGTVVESKGSKQAFEVKAISIIVEGESPEDYPLQKKRHGVEFLRTISHLRPRTNLYSAVFRVRSLAAFAIHKYFNENNFVYVHTPILTASDCEGAGEMFNVTSLDLKNIKLDENKEVDYKEDFFGKMVSLSVSGQLSAEAFAQALRNVYTFGPTFRAENSNTTRHAAEFWMMEPEIAFADLTDNMDLAEDMTKYVIRYVMENAPEEIEFFNSFVEKGLKDKLTNIVESDFGRVSYTEAIDILLKCDEKFEFPVSWGIDLQTEHERYLAEVVYKRPVFVTDYPKEIKSFYMRINEDGKTVAAMDLLVPEIGEMMGGSQREERYDVLLERMEECGLKAEDYWWYLELRKFGTTKHAGFGLGFERLIMYLTGVSNIRDVIPFARTSKNAEF